MRLVRWMTVLCLPGIVWAQRYSFKSYGQRDGLQNLAVHCLLQDRVGFLWVGTQNGLFRYDGFRFRGFHKADGLPSSRIESLYETPDGTLWVGTRSGPARRRGDHFEAADVGPGPELMGTWGMVADAEGRLDRKSTRLNSSHIQKSRMPSSA